MMFTQEDAKRFLRLGERFPYDQGDDDTVVPSPDAAHLAARAVICELNGRGGADAFFGGLDAELRQEIVGNLATIIRTATPEEFNNVITELGKNDQ